MTGLADSLDRYLLPLVLISAALGAGLPGPGRRADAAGAILITLIFGTAAAYAVRRRG